MACHYSDRILIVMTVKLPNLISFTFQLSARQRVGSGGCHQEDQSIRTPDLLPENFARNSNPHSISARKCKAFYILISIAHNYGSCSTV